MMINYFFVSNINSIDPRDFFDVSGSRQGLLETSNSIYYGLREFSESIIINNIMCSNN